MINGKQEKKVEEDTTTQASQNPPKPDPAHKRLEGLVGTWTLKGRTLDSKEDNITGWTTFEWMLGGFS